MRLWWGEGYRTFSETQNLPDLISNWLPWKRDPVGLRYVPDNVKLWVIFAYELLTKASGRKWMLELPAVINIFFRMATGSALQALHGMYKMSHPSPSVLRKKYTSCTHIAFTVRWAQSLNMRSAGWKSHILCQGIVYMKGWWKVDFEKKNNDARCQSGKPGRVRPDICYFLKLFT